MMCIPPEILHATLSGFGGPLITRTNSEATLKPVLQWSESHVSDAREVAPLPAIYLLGKDTKDSTRISI